MANTRFTAAMSVNNAACNIFQDLTGGTIVAGDTNGDAIADFAITLTGIHDLAAAEFIL